MEQKADGVKELGRKLDLDGYRYIYVVYSENVKELLDEEAQTTLDGVDNINDAMRLNFAKDRTVQVIYKGAELGTYPWSALYGYYAIEMDDEVPENVLITMEEDGSLSVQYSDDDDYLTFKCVKSAGEE